jgi:secreted trypsin-like serine protease
LSDGFAQTGAGTKRDATTRLNSISNVVLDIGDLFHKTCNGDSGGPAFMTIDGVETLVGVTSYGFIFCLGDGFDTRIDLYNSFIAQYLR